MFRIQFLHGLALGTHDMRLIGRAESHALGHLPHSAVWGRPAKLILAGARIQLRNVTPPGIGLRADQPRRRWMKQAATMGTCRAMSGPRLGASQPDHPTGNAPRGQQRGSSGRRPTRGGTARSAETGGRARRAGDFAHGFGPAGDL
jgi:hypothetical protein